MPKFTVAFDLRSTAFVTFEAVDGQEALLIAYGSAIHDKNYDNEIVHTTELVSLRKEEDDRPGEMVFHGGRTLRPSEYHQVL